MAVRGNYRKIKKERRSSMKTRFLGVNKQWIGDAFRWAMNKSQPASFSNRLFMKYLGKHSLVMLPHSVRFWVRDYYGSPKYGNVWLSLTIMRGDLYRKSLSRTNIIIIFLTYWYKILWYVRILNIFYMSIQFTHMTFFLLHLVCVWINSDRH